MQEKLLSFLPFFHKNPHLYEAAVEQSYRRFSFQNYCAVVDGGAHTGRHVLPMLDVVRNNGLVVGFEVIPSLIKILRKCTAGYSNFILHEQALWHEEAELDFCIIKNNLGYSGLRERVLSFAADVEKTKVSATTLDVVAKSIGAPIAYVKLDLEGGEFAALRGAAHLLSVSRPLVVFENGLSNSARLYEYACRDFLNYFHDLDYQIVDFFGREVDQSYWDAQLTTYMFLAIPRNSQIAYWHENVWPDLMLSVIDEFLKDRATT